MNGLRKVRVPSWGIVERRNMHANIGQARC